MDIIRWASDDGAEQRRYPRQPLDPPLKGVLQIVGSPPRQLVVDVLDISEGGACLAMLPPRILMKGDRATLVTPLQTVAVRVCWSSPDGRLITVGVAYGNPPA